MIKYTIVPTHITDIRPGDTIELETGVLATVCRKDIRYSKDRDCSLFGDSYRLGTKPVKKAVIFKAMPA